MKRPISRRFPATVALAAMMVAGIATADPATAVNLQATPGPEDPCLTVAGAGSQGSGMQGHMGAATPEAGGHGMQMDVEFDLMFIDMMIPHHQEAIDMAQVVLIRSGNDEVRALAEAVIAAQTAEIEQMNGWREAWYPDAGEPPVMSQADAMQKMGGFGEGAMMMETGAMLAELCAADDVDVAFLTLMAPHHESAILMAEAALAQATHEELRTLAQAVVDTQTAEIAAMQSILAGLTGTPAAGS